MHNIRLKPPRLNDVGWGEPYDTHNSTGTGAAVGPQLEIERCGTLRLQLVVVAIGGTLPTLDVVVQHSPDGATWADVAAFAQKTGVSSEWKVFGPCHRFVRPKWTIAGTSPAFQFSVLGQGV
ncbi:MAG TPA: hypothetical protein VK550_17355 [Polyangiaceae bacterium]|nr:hypothetical protein [Polyangiaceae bacterium]